MNDLERLKRAEEAGPMAVVVMDMPDVCISHKKRCGIFTEDDYGFFCAKTGEEVKWEHKPDWCPLREAIGIIEPNGHVVYFREVEE